MPSINSGASAAQFQNRIGQMRPSQTTNGGNNLYRGSSIIPESASVNADVVTVTPDNIGSLNGEVLLTPQQTKELYEKGSLQVRREFQTAESNEGFMTLTSKLAAALVGPSRSVAAIQIDPLFLEMIKDPNAKVGMGYTRVEKETWTVLPSPEEQTVPPSTLPKPAPPYPDPNLPSYGNREPHVSTPEKEVPSSAEIYRIARTPGEAGRNTLMIQQYKEQGYPSLGNGEQVGDTTYDGATAEAILGREMQVPFQYVGRASLNFNNASLPGAVAFNQKMAAKVGMTYQGVASNGEALIHDKNGNRVSSTDYKNAVAKEMGLGSFDNFQKLQEQVKFTQAVGYTDPLNATALAAQVADQSSGQIQSQLQKMHDGFSLDNTRHEYFTSNDLANFPTTEGRTRLDEYKDATLSTPIPDGLMDEYQALYNQKNGTSLSLDQIKAANPSLMDMYAIHAQTFQPSLGITFKDGKANIPEGSTNSVLNARIVLEANTSNGGEDQLLYGPESVGIINNRVAQQFEGVTNMELRVVDGSGQEVTVAPENIVEFLQFHNSGSHENAGADSIFNDVEADITRRYNAGTDGIDYTTVGNGFIPVEGGVPTPGAGAPTTATITESINKNIQELNAPGLNEEGKAKLLTAIESQINMLPEEARGEASLNINGQNYSPNDWLKPAVDGGPPTIREQVEAVADQKMPDSLHDAILINTNTAKSGERYAPGTAEMLRGHIERDLGQLKSQLSAAGDTPIMINAAPPATGKVQLTEAYISELENTANEALEGMILNEARDIEENPQNYNRAEDGSSTPKSNTELAAQNIDYVNSHIKPELSNGGITPEKVEELKPHLQSAASHIFTDLKSHNIVEGPFDAAALSEVTAEDVRAKVPDQAIAGKIIENLDNLKKAQTTLGIAPELNISHDINQGLHRLKQKAENFEHEASKIAFTDQLKQVAQLDDGETFNTFISEAYGLPAPSEDNAAHYATLRTEALNGNLTFPPNIQAVPQDEIGGANGAYVRGNDGEGTILIAQEILGDDAKVQQVFAEEMFHHLEHHASIQAIGGGAHETPGDEGRGALKALLAINEDGARGAEAIGAAAQQGHGEQSSVQGTDAIQMNTRDSDRGAIGSATIEFSSDAPETTTAPPTEDEVEAPVRFNTPQEGPVVQEDPLDIPNREGVNMEIPTLNANPTRRVDETGVDPEAFNYAPAFEGEGTPAPEDDGEKKGFDVGQFAVALPKAIQGVGVGIMQHAQELSQLADQLFKRGVANNLSNASSLMNHAQSLNGYHNTSPDFTNNKMSPNYSRRPQYGDQNAQAINQKRDQYYAQKQSELAKNNAEQQERLMKKPVVG